MSKDTYEYIWYIDIHCIYMDHWHILLILSICQVLRQIDAFEASIKLTNLIKPRSNLVESWTANMKAVYLLRSFAGHFIVEDIH